MDQPVRLDRLRLALGLDQAVAGEAVEDLVEVADIQAAPLVAHCLLEAAFVILGMLAVADALLINTPHLLLADEPTGNLDSHTATGILDRLIRLRDGAVIDDIEISGGYPVDETIRRVGQLG